MQSIEVENHRDSTLRTRIALKRILSDTKLTPPPAGMKSDKIVVPVRIESNMTREEVIELLEKTSKELSEKAKKLRQQQ